MSEEVQTVPTFMYRMGEGGKIESKVFELEPGKGVKGWVDTPAKCAKPAPKPKATADGEDSPSND